MYMTDLPTPDKGKSADSTKSSEIIFIFYQDQDETNLFCIKAPAGAQELGKKW